MSGNKYGYDAWWKIAEKDLEAAEFLLHAPSKLGFAVGFHAQQAAEKYLKSYLVSQAVSPDRTHHLRRLLKECVAFEPALAALKPECDVLFPFAVDPRYPNLLVEPDAEVCKTLISAAKKIRAAVRQVLPKPRNGRDR